MAATLETLQIEFRASMGNLQSQLKGVKTQLAGVSTQATKAGGALSKLGTILKLYVFTRLARAIWNVGKESLSMANDVVESENLFAVSMGNMADEARKWSQELGAALGLNEYNLRKNVGTFNVMFKSMGQSEQAAYDMATSLTELAEDMASFYNLDSEEAFTKLRAGITGETEPLKRLGILVDENTVKQYALRMGLISAGQEMSQSVKLQARYAAIMDQTAKAQGDLARTIDSPVNQLRILGNMFDMAKITAGQGLQAIQAIVIPILKEVARAAQFAATAFKNFLWALTGFRGVGASAANSAAAGATANKALANTLDKTADGYKKAGAAAKKAAKDGQVGLKAFDEINKLTEENAAGGGAGIGEVPEEVVDTNLMTEAMEALGPAISAAADWLQRLWDKAEPTRAALGRLWDKLKESAAIVWDNIKWFYDNILVPLGNFVLTKGAPAFIDMLTAAVNTANTALEAARPALEKFYNDVLVPIGEWTAQAALDALGWLKDKFDEISTWIKNNPEKFETITTVMLDLAAAIGGLLVINEVITAFNSLKAAISLLSNPTNLIMIGIALLIAALIYCVTNWEEVKDAAEDAWVATQKAWQDFANWFETKVAKPIRDKIADAIAKVELAWTEFLVWLGLKKATALVEIQERVNRVVHYTSTGGHEYAHNEFENRPPSPTTITDWAAPGYLGGVGLVQPPTHALLPEFIPPDPGHFARGGVFAPNKAFVGVLGDQRYGRNIETPEGLMRDIFREELYASALSPVQSRGYGYNEMDAASGGSIVQQAIEGVLNRLTVQLIVDGQTFGKASIRAINDMQRLAGRPLLEM